MRSLIEALSSPYLVAHFQRLCGAQWAEPDKENVLFPQKRIQNGVISDPEFVLKNKFLYHGFLVCSEMAGKPFYYVLVPTCSWVMDIGIARKTMMQLALAMYIGQSAKDILRRERPASPPVIRLEKTYELEYGMPSTHTIAGTITAFSLVVFTGQIYKIRRKECLIAASLWTSCIAISRVYVGMHTVWQILVGAVAAGLLAFLPVQIMSTIDEKLLTSSALTSIAVVAGSVLSYIIFQLDSEIDPETNLPRWNTARGDTTELVGLCMGFLVGTKWSIAQGLYEYRIPGNPLLSIQIQDYKRTVTQVLAGGLMLVTFVRIFKAASFQIFTKIGGISLYDMERVKRSPKVELPHKYISGLFAGVVAASVIPWIFNEFQFW